MGPAGSKGATTESSSVIDLLLTDLFVGDTSPSTPVKKLGLAAPSPTEGMLLTGDALPRTGLVDLFDRAGDTLPVLFLVDTG